MRRLLSWLVGLPAAVLLVGFAVANRKWVDISLDPFDSSNPAVYLHIPLWSVLVLGIFLGLVAGWIGAWVNQGGWRRHARALRHDNERLRMENQRLQAEIDAQTRSMQQDSGLIGTM